MMSVSTEPAAADHAVDPAARIAEAAQLLDGIGDTLSADATHRVRVASEVLRALPADAMNKHAVELLLAIARYFVYASQPLAGIGPASQAETAARVLDDRTLLRKALNLHGQHLSDTANLPDATRCFSEALEIAEATGDTIGQASVLNNIGLLLLHASLTADAVACFEKVLDLSAGNATLRIVREGALLNAALAALHERDVAKSYQLCNRALQSSASPNTPTEFYQRAVIESVYARTLLGLGDLRLANKHAVLAREYAAVSQIPRAELDSEIALGLAEVAANSADIGLSRIKRMTEFSRAKVPSYLVETLSVAVSAYERAGQPDVALIYLHDLLALNKQSRATQLLMHHRRHVDAIQRSQPDEPDAVDNQLRWQQGELRGKLAVADRDRIRNLGQLVEQQAIAAERLDDTTGEHCYRVGRLASLLGKEVGLEDDVCFLIDLAARLHDIGKLVVPDAILLKPGKLTPGEREIMETHTVAGWEILGKTDIPQMHIAQEIARHHHERWDGTGYPDRLRSTAIPIAARVSALADVFDALTHKRPYKEAWPVADALAEISRLRGRQFDPDVTDVFLDLVPRLQREHGDLDAFLAVEARNSPYIRAREKIARSLKGDNPEVSLFELRR
jgi:putative two-component system response regulator